MKILYSSRATSSVSEVAKWRHLRGFCYITTTNAPSLEKDYNSLVGEPKLSH
jgi:hypothetical protein